MKSKRLINWFCVQFRHGFHFKWWRMDIKVACRILRIWTFKLESFKKRGFYSIFFEGFGLERSYVKYHTSNFYFHVSSLKPMSELHTQSIKKSLWIWCYVMCQEFFEICISFWYKTPQKSIYAPKNIFLVQWLYLMFYFIMKQDVSKSHHTKTSFVHFCV